MFVSNDIKYIGVNDLQIDLFEGQYKVPLGMSYNSYAIIDEKVAIMDTVDANFVAEWLKNIKEAIADRTPDYLVVQHMEPDHSAGIFEFANTYPSAVIVASAKAFAMIKNFFNADFSERRVVVSDGDTLSLGKHTLAFVTAPMVHWPEVIMSYETSEKILFSADAFGKFGAYDAEEDWTDEARRYYIGIVGKYGPQVQAVLKKAKDLDIKKICALHGPILTENLGKYIALYDKWSRYEAECDGVLIAYTSIYGNTRRAAKLLEDALARKGVSVKSYDLARCDMAAAYADAFKYSKLVLASPTYNASIFPFMREFINHLTERNFGHRKVAFIENGSWAPMAAKVMRGMLESCKNLEYAENNVKILSSVNSDVIAEIDKLAEEISK